MAKELTTADIYMTHIYHYYSIIPTLSLLPSFAQSYEPMTSIKVCLKWPHSPINVVSGHGIEMCCGQLWVWHIFCGQDLWWTKPLHIFHWSCWDTNGPLFRVRFGESLVYRLYSEIDHLHLSIEAQYVSHLLPLGDCHKMWKSCHSFIDSVNILWCTWITLLSQLSWGSSCMKDHYCYFLYAWSTH